MERVTLNELKWYVIYAAAVYLVFSLSGCGPTVGWSVNFGVNPISSVQDEKGLNANDLPNRRFNWDNNKPRM